MKLTHCLATGILLLTTLGASAALQLFTDGRTIAPDSPIGLVSYGNYTDANVGDHVMGTTVGLNLSGGYNGNLYAYLVAPNGTMVVLLNEPGVSVNAFGASGAGLNITLTSAFTSQGNIQNVTSSDVLTGAYNAAGNLADFGIGTAPGGLINGTWTLYFSDQTSGGGTTTLNSWSLDFSPVPEPVNVTLRVFGALLLAMTTARCWASKIGR